MYIKIMLLHQAWAIIFLTIVLTTTASTETQFQILFTPDAPEFAEAAAEYEQIWAAEGTRMIQAMERESGLRFNETQIRAIVLEAASSSGFREIPMRLRASYPPDVKKGTLIHELGHRLQGHLFRKEDEDHPYLFLYLYDVWTDLYGKEFADHQVKIESARKGLYDYESAWKDALSLTKAQRKAKWQAYLASRKKP